MASNDTFHQLFSATFLLFLATHSLATAQHVAPAAAPSPASSGFQTAGLGDECLTGGNIKPIVCLPGLYCDVGPQPEGQPGVPHRNPDVASKGICRSFNGTGGVGTPCTLPDPTFHRHQHGEGRMHEMGSQCLPGLQCVSSSNSTKSASGPTATSAAPSPSSNDSTTPGTCQPVDGTSFCNSTAAAPGAECRVGGNICPIYCQAGYYCNVSLDTMAPSPIPAIGFWHGHNPDAAHFGTCQPINSTNFNNSLGDGGHMCYNTAQGAGAAPSACPGGLDCLLVAPQFVMSSPSSTGMEHNHVVGYCGSPGLLPARNESCAPGQEGSPCTVGANSTTPGNCSTGLTCAANTTGSTNQTTSSARSALAASNLNSGVCTNATQLYIALSAAAAASPPPPASSPEGSTSKPPGAGSPSPPPNAQRRSVISAPLLVPAAATMALLCLMIL